MTDKVLSTCKPKFQKKATHFSYKNEPLELVFARVLYSGFGVSDRYFFNGYIEIPLISNCVVKLPINERPNNFVRVFLFRHPFMTNLPCFGHSCAPTNTNLFNILWFSCQGKSRDIVNQRTCRILWLIFAQHGLFGILLTVYSALSRLTDHGIYYIIRCGIWLLTVFHIPYIYFQRKLRKVIQPQWYLSFFVQYSRMKNNASFWISCQSVSLWWTASSSIL